VNDELPRPLEILLVDDNPADVRLTMEALKEGSPQYHLHVARDGMEALSFLRRQEPFGDAPRPDLVLLDLNMPRMSGREVLADAKSDPALRSIPVVVLTTSKAEEDVLRSYDLHANCYITKPVALHDFLDVLRQVEGFWTNVVRLPA
jgi:two-component system, chemotaxis family, response regulator Rcp1